MVDNCAESIASDPWAKGMDLSLHRLFGNGWKEGLAAKQAVHAAGTLRVRVEKAE